MNPSQEEIGAVEVVDSMNNVEFDVDANIFRAEYDSSRDQPSLAIVAVVAAASNRDAIELSPLHSAIDTETLDNLLSKTTTDDEKNTCLSFSYEGFAVTAFSEGTIEASPIENT
ncbi:HalOD1 output domain-containing protein [Natrinema sp. H-ect1]|uniref:HalOD1 output domain-containing protein n=1 Tax=Natrinema sp. H-ect1 TaxID=3242700 RepID=UPI00359F0786